MIEGILEQIKAFVVGQFAGVVAYIADPIWGWAIIVAAIVAGCIMVGWFFPAVRSFFGAVALASVAFVVGAWKERSAIRAKPKPTPRPKPKPPPSPGSWFG
jgi:hypothetical protein